MKLCFGLLIWLGCSWWSRAQTLSYYSDIKPIIDRQCTGCHAKGKTAPFPLTAYSDLEKRGGFIKKVITTRYMPPWYAAPGFQAYHNERRLSDEEIEIITKWIDQGMREGKRRGKTKTEDRTGDEEPIADLTLQMQHPFTIPGDNSEQFRIFVIPTQQQEERYIQAIDFQPGNKQLAHHARLMVDTTHLLRADDGARAGDTSTAFTRLNIQLANNFWYGWVPGNLPVFYPEGIGKRLPAGTDLILNMHYSPSPVPAQDQASIQLYFCKEKPRRLIQTLTLDESWISNGPFRIPAGQVIKFYMRSPLVPRDLTLITVLPHMHLLGKSFKAFAITPTGQVIHLINIPDWNFNWQMAYEFQHPILLPKGSVIYAEAVYDNTLNNPRNPFSPPREATYGWGTYNEMMNLIVEYLDYEPGDEHLDWFGPNNQ